MIVALRRAQLAALVATLPAAAAVGEPRAAVADAASAPRSLQARVAAVRAAWGRAAPAETPGDATASLATPTAAQSPNWTNWPKWSKWSNWANK